MKGRDRQNGLQYLKLLLFKGHCEEKKKGD